MFRLRWKPDFGPVFFELQRFRPILFDPKYITTYTYKQILRRKLVLSKFHFQKNQFFGPDDLLNTTIQTDPL